MAHAIPATVVNKMPSLHWIQALTTGTDHLLTLTLPKDIIVTSARGIHGPQMSEIAFLYMLSHFRDIRRFLKNQSQAIWESRPQKLLWGKTVTILGVGAISEELALRCKAFGMRVIGVFEPHRRRQFRQDLHPRAASTRRWRKPTSSSYWCLIRPRPITWSTAAFWRP